MAFVIPFSRSTGIRTVLRVKGVCHVHLWLDLVRGLGQVIAVLIRLDFGESQVRLRVKQARVDGHALRIEDFRTGRDLGRSCRAHGDNLAPGHHNNAVFNGAVRYGEQPSANNGNGV